MVEGQIQGAIVCAAKRIGYDSVKYGKQKHLRYKKWHGQEKQLLKGMIWECGQE